jgi:hypothetical protein
MNGKSIPADASGAPLYCLRRTGCRLIGICRNAHTSLSNWIFAEAFAHRLPTNRPSRTFGACKSGNPGPCRCASRWISMHIFYWQF